MEKTVPDMDIDEDQGSEEASDKSSDTMETENSLNFSQSNEVIFVGMFSTFPTTIFKFFCDKFSLL